MQSLRKRRLDHVHEIGLKSVWNRAEIGLVSYSRYYCLQFFLISLSLDWMKSPRAASISRLLVTAPSIPTSLTQSSSSANSRSLLSLESLDIGTETGRVSGGALGYILSSLNFLELMLGDEQCYSGCRRLQGRGCKMQPAIWNPENVNHDKLSIIIANLDGPFEHFLE